MKYKVGDFIIWNRPRRDVIIAKIFQVDKICNRYRYIFIKHTEDTSLQGTAFDFNITAVEANTRLLTNEDKLELL